MALLDIIRQNREQLTSAPQAPAVETQRVQELLSAKSGKSISPTQQAPISNLGEQQSKAAQATQMKSIVQPEIQRQQKAAEIQQKGQKEQQRGALQQIDVQRKGQTAQFQIKANQILSNLEQQRDALTFDQKQAKMEQASFLLAMNDQEYTRSLQDVAQRKRLDNQLNFEQEMQSLQFGDTINLLKSKLGMDNILQMNDREYRKQMSQLSVEDAIQIADIEMDANEEFGALQRELISTQAKAGAQAAALQTQAQGLNDLISGGAKGYTAYRESEKSDKSVKSEE
jgi:hypothetical protein